LVPLKVGRAWKKRFFPFKQGDIFLDGKKVRKALENLRQDLRRNTDSSTSLPSRTPKVDDVNKNHQPDAGGFDEQKQYFRQAAIDFSGNTTTRGQSHSPRA